MTRKEEIENAAYRSSFNSDDYGPFIRGAEWADKTMIKKVIAWIKDNIDLVAENAVSLKSGYQEIVMMDNFEQKFREAMEE